MEQNQLSAGESSGSGSSSLDQTIAFITEFNTNAQIFNEALFPLLLVAVDRVNNQRAELNQTQMDVRQLAQQVESLLGQRLGAADNAGFASSERTDARSASTGPSIS